MRTWFLLACGEWCLIEASILFTPIFSFLILLTIEGILAGISLFTHTGWIAIWLTDIKFSQLLHVAHQTIIKSCVSLSLVFFRYFHKGVNLSLISLRLTLYSFGKSRTLSNYLVLFQFKGQQTASICTLTNFDLQ